ncbi:hypothetical protein [Streptomyces sp. NPDC059063]|uniref:hypothetical protein n=1 Tax=unclassified Streptomyces TaxID=2593676 RepID=UPI00369B1022
MDVWTLVLLGAAGGLLRGVLDVYTRFVDWQTDRRLHRQLSAEQAGPAPRFQDHFDPVADPIAAGVHSVMGAGAAVLFGTTGQISGAYAALVVGISAPLLLTQLGRIQSVSDAVTGGSQTADATPPPPAQLPQPAPARPAIADVRTLGLPPDDPAREPQPNGRPADPAPGPGRGARRLPRRPAVGEEGTQ